jgi:hypothetical protein
MDELTNGRIDELTNGRMDELTNGRMDEWTNGRMGELANWRIGMIEGAGTAAADTHPHISNCDPAGPARNIHGEIRRAPPVHLSDV